jgi:hypothetical protein
MKRRKKGGNECSFLFYHMKIINVDEKAFEGVLGSIDKKTGKMDGLVIKFKDSLVIVEEGRVNVSLGEEMALGERAKVEEAGKAPKRQRIDDDVGKPRLVSGTQVNVVASKDPMAELQQALKMIGNCAYCFSITGKCYGHYLGKCGLLGGRCHKCFGEKASKNHDGCPAKDSMPANIGICYYCGLEPSHHADGTFGKPTCRTWANDRLLSLGLIHWTNDGRYNSLKLKPPIARHDEDGNIDYVAFFNWFFKFDEVTYLPNYYKYLMNILRRQ